MNYIMNYSNAFYRRHMNPLKMAPFPKQFDSSQVGLLYSYSIIMRLLFRNDALSDLQMEI